MDIKFQIFILFLLVAILNQLGIHSVADAIDKFMWVVAIMYSLENSGKSLPGRGSVGEKDQGDSCGRPPSRG